MVRIRFDDVAFWILILAALAVILWLLKGSPVSENALVSIGIFIISSQVFLWKKYFEMDKKAAVSFVKFRSDIKDNFYEVNNNMEKLDEGIKSKLEGRNDKLEKIEGLIKK